MPATTVTAHAILRFAERVLDLDSSAIKRTILAAIPDRDGLYPLPGLGVAARVKNHVVVSIVPDRNWPKPPKKTVPNAARPVPDNPVEAS